MPLGADLVFPPDSEDAYDGFKLDVQSIEFGQQKSQSLRAGSGT